MTLGGGSTSVMNGVEVVLPGNRVGRQTFESIDQHRTGKPVQVPFATA